MTNLENGKSADFGDMLCSACKTFWKVHVKLSYTKNSVFFKI